MSKTIFITGATDGIGLLAAKVLAAEGHKVLLHGRNSVKLSAAAGEVGGKVETYLADLKRIADVRDMATKVLETQGRIDVLMNNAGVLKLPDPKTAEGYDARFMVNTFAPYVLTRMLMPIIPKSGRIVNLSSAAQAPIDLEALHGRTQYDDMGAYAQSKLAITIWTRELAKELGDGPVVVAVNPGSLLASKMVKEGFGIAGNDLSIGANILRDAALDPSFATATGLYFDNDSGAFTNPHVSALDSAQSAVVMAAINEAVAKLA